MKRIVNIISLVAASAALWIACSEDDVVVSRHSLSLDVTLPVSSAVEATRAIGDPGLAEFFERPNHLYLFLAIGKPTTPAENPVYYYYFPTGQERWNRSADSLVFKSKMDQEINWDNSIPLTEDLECRAYIVASFDAITTEPIISYNAVRKVTNAGFTESKLLDLKFFANQSPTDYSTPSLRDIYSTPYNLSSGWSLLPSANADRTNYYGTVKDIRIVGDAGIITVKDTLYRTAAKIDFQWNAKSAAQVNKMVNAVVNNAPKMGYLFKPALTATSDTYRKVLLNGGTLPSGIEDLNKEHAARYADAQSINVGNQWNGRAYTYVLQPGNLNYTLTTSEGGTHDHTAIRPQSNGNTNEIFAAWYKLDFNLLDAESK